MKGAEMKAIGETFGAEIESAGLAGLPFSWGSDGRIEFGAGMRGEQIAAVEAVYQAHDPGATGQVDLPN